MLKRNFSPPATLYQAALEPKPLTSLDIPFQETLPDNVCHLVDAERAFLERLTMFLRTTAAPCVEMEPDSILVSLTEALVTIHNKHSKLLKVWPVMIGANGSGIARASSRDSGIRLSYHQDDACGGKMHTLLLILS
ncbi:hypothetical protein DSO57_1005657 [Entomophthora muscae]|uniref:Uncharacterized protein n=1 Tax=Entomophthora muscae TaxID=34485 RepID=A0ACC2RYX0_9FUNG|nr:hypothetical protein DSO57_1005657 [Entomophthora muscae]